MKFWQSFTPTEKRLTISCFVAMLLCLLFLLSDSLFSFLIRSKDRDRALVGQIAFQEKDVRRKQADQFVWFSAKKQDLLRAGDAVYTGAKASLKIRLSSGSALDVGENSLISFDEYDGENLARLGAGEFKIKVDGKLKVLIGDEVKVFEGNNSELSINVDQNKNATILSANGSIVKSDARKIKKMDEIVQVDRSAKQLTAFWKLYDLYEPSGDSLQLKNKIAEQVDYDLKLDWIARNLKSRWVQVSSGSDFSIEKSIKFQAISGLEQTVKAYVGKNFWRVKSEDGELWSIPGQFDLHPQYLPNAAPVLTENFIRLPIKADPIAMTIPKLDRIESVGHVVEASSTSEFVPEKTKTFWSKGKDISLTFFRPGIFYYRIRAVNEKQQLSEWSKTQKYDIYYVEAPSIPILSSLNLRQMSKPETVNLQWKSKDQEVYTEILDPDGKIVGKFSGKNIHWKPQKPGRYTARSYSKNIIGERSGYSKPEEFAFNEPPKAIAQQKPKEEKKKKREPAQENKVVQKLERRQEQYWNDPYRERRLSVQGLLWTLQSSQQDFYEQESPVATGLGLNYLDWWGSHGLEASFKTAVFGFNSAGSSQSLKDLEMRYHYRILTGFPLGFARQLQTSVFFGYEMYRNTGGDNFSSQYDLMKFGTSLQFPLWHRWSTGGEFVYGSGFDGSTKYELSGHMTYYFDKKWSGGMGYRIHLLEAGSASSSPGGVLPYREGYTEGYSVLNYHF